MSETRARKLLQERLWDTYIDDGAVSISGEITEEVIASYNPIVWTDCLIQRRPWTAIRMGAHINELGMVIYGEGFSKVCWPDEWDADYGRVLCIRKALAEIARGAVILAKRSPRRWMSKI